MSQFGCFVVSKKYFETLVYCCNALHFICIMPIQSQLRLEQTILIMLTVATTRQSALLVFGDLEETFNF